MSQQLIVTGVIEFGLIVLTVVLLMQPSFLYQSQGHTKWRTFSAWSGLVLLCLTFCWSVIFGAILYLHRLMMRV